MLMPRLDCVVEERSIDRRARLLTYRTSQVPHQKNLTTVAPRAGIKRAENTISKPSGGLRNIDDESDADPIHSFGGSDLCDARYEAFV